MHENCTPSHHLTLKQITASQVLRATAAGRTPFAATEIAKSVVVGLDRKQGSGGIVNHEFLWKTKTPVIMSWSIWAVCKKWF